MCSRKVVPLRLFSRLVDYFGGRYSTFPSLYRRWLSIPFRLSSSAWLDLFSSQADAFEAWLLPVSISVGLFGTFLFSGRRFWGLASQRHPFRRPVPHFSLLRPTLLALGFFQAPFPSAYLTLFFSQADAFGSWLLPAAFSVGLFDTFLFSGRRFWLLASPIRLFRRAIWVFSCFCPPQLALCFRKCSFSASYLDVFLYLPLFYHECHTLLSEVSHTTIGSIYNDDGRVKSPTRWGT